tara:strand:- start:323 stop:2872 length:2550 start_codon:yes stop_codon:yes gene_type:complete
MKSFKNFYESAAGESSGRDTAAAKKKTPKDYDPVGDIKKAAAAVRDFVNPPRSKSNDPVVRAGGSYTGRGGAPVMPGQSKTGERKTKKKSRSANLPADYKETERAAFDKASKSKKTDGGGGGGGDRTAPPSAPPKSKKRSAKDDPRNAKYNAMRSDLAKSAFKTKKDRDGATKATEKVGMDAWAKANPKLAAAKKKRDATRGTSKSDNPLMKKYIKDRESRGERLQKISKQAKADTIANSPNAASINKKQTERQASVDKAIKSVNTPRTPEASAKTPTKALANKGSGRSGGFGAGTYGSGMPSNPPVRAKTPAPAPATALGTVKVGDKVGYSKGGEVKKKTKKESFLGFGEYLAEKKTKIKINPKKEDMLEKTMKPEKGEDCHCDHTKNEKKKRKEDTDHTEGTPEVSNESINQEVLAYVSQEEVSEEGYQEGYQTETDLTEGEQLDELSDNMLKAIYPKGMSKGLKQTIKPGGSNALGVKNDATSAGGGKFYTNNARLLARAPAQYVRGKVPEPSPSANTPAPKPEPAKPAAPKPNPIQANRPGFDSKGIETNKKVQNAKLAGKKASDISKAQKDKLSGKKSSYSGFTETKKLKSFGSISSMNEEQLDEIFGSIAKAVGSIFKGAKKVVQPKPQQQPQAQQQQKPSAAQRFASLSAPSQSVGKLSAGPVKVNPSSTANAASQAIDKVSTPTPKAVDPKLDKPEKKKPEKKKKAEDEKLKGKSVAMTKEEIELDERTRYAKETGKSAKTGRESKRGGRGAPSGAVAAVMADITKRYGKGAIVGTGQQSKKKKGEKKEGEGGKYQKMADRKKKTADDAKKRGFKSSQDYVNTMARYGGKDNYDRGRGLGT